VNPLLENLHPYPFERLRLLLSGLKPDPGATPINLGIGEPQHPTAEVILTGLAENTALLGKYPPTGGTPELRHSISHWVARRYAIAAPNPDREVLPVAGTREALFAFAQAVLNPKEDSVVLLPNPFYQIYEGAAIMAGAEPFYVPTPEEKDYLPDWTVVPAEVWPRVRLAYVCSPGNPSGSVMSLDDWQEVFRLSDQFGFIVAADECYSEIYNGEPPIGALEAAVKLGRSNERIVVFNSLSKRSSAPGLRSGFVAGDPDILAKFLLYRTYHGAAPSSQVQAASAAAWSEETHVEQNRRKYQDKYEMVRRILPDARIPAGGFFLWHRCDDDETLVKTLYQRAGLTVLPGRYLGRDVNGTNPGLNHIRIALVPELETCEAALIKLRDILAA